MEPDNMVDAGIDLEATELGHLTFPLDPEGTATTDGTLLSSLTTDAISDDISTTTVLTALPHQIETSYPRGLTSVGHTHYGGHLQATTSFELTDLGVTSGIDVSSKLVSDSSDILFASGGPMQPNIALATWSPDMISTVEQLGEFTQESSLLSELKNFSQSQAPMPTLGTSYLTTTKPNNFIQTQDINTLNKIGQVTVQNHQIYHQLMPRNSATNNISIRHFENVQQQQPPAVASSTSAFTVRLPIPTALSKGVQLHLVARGHGELPINSTLGQQVVTEANIGHITQQQQTSTATGLMLFRDKATGKSYIIPTGPTSVFVNSAGNIQLQQPQVIQNVSSSHSGCESPEIDVIGNCNDPYEDLGIAEPQPVIDVNEFLNIPPKVINSENSLPDDVQTVQDICVFNNEIVNDTEFQGHDNNVTIANNIDENKKEIIIVSPYFNIPTKVDATISDNNGNEVLEKEDNINKISVELDPSSAATGEDLIKMMAVKKSTRRTETDKPDEYFSPDSDSFEEKDEQNADSQSSTYNIEINKSFESDDEHSKDVSFDACELDISIHSEDVEMDSSITETEQRIASIVPDSMKDFVRDIFEDEDALDKEYIQEIMDDTGPAETRTSESSALSPGDIAKHAVQKLADKVNQPKGLDVKAKTLPAVSVQVDKSQVVTVDGQRKWKCNICPKMYSTKHNLVTHILSHCEIKPHCCVICGKLFKQPSHLQTHMLTHKQIRDHVCKTCGKGFTQQCHLKRHSAVHMEKRPHVCDICNRGFAYPSELNVHKQRHANSQNQELACDKCESVFDSAKKLKLHASKHKNTEELTCKDCGKVFVYPSQLRDHTMKHNGTRPYICSECGVDFMKEHHLKAHQFTHTGEKPFSCTVCHRTFNQKANLQRHVLIHEQKKRYKCDKCSKEFSQAQVLKSHMATHEETKAYKCDECGKRFSRQHNLKGHMALHQGNKKYVCFCGAAFTLKGNLNRHKKGKHNLGPSEEEPTEQIAAETAAKILNMMSAKRILPNVNGIETNNGQQIEAAPALTTSYVIIRTSGGNSQLVDQNVKMGAIAVKRLLPKEQLVEVSNQNEDESPLPKKKRKSVPSKIISKEGKIIDENGLEEGTNKLSSVINGESCEKMGIISPVKRKQLKPKCLPFNNNEAVNVNGATAETVKAVPGSTRRKQKAVAKANVLEPIEVQDEAEQEWQGDSGSGMDTIGEQLSKDAIDESNKCLVDIQKENVAEQKSINISTLTSFSNLSAVIGTNNKIILEEVT